MSLGANSVAVPDRFHCASGQTENRHFRRIDDGGEIGASYSAQAGNAEGTALELIGFQLALPGPAAQIREYFRQFLNPRQSAFRITGTTRPAGGVNGDSDVDVLLADQSGTVAPQRAVEIGKILQSLGCRPDDEDQRTDLRLSRPLRSRRSIPF